MKRMVEEPRGGNWIPSAFCGPVSLMQKKENKRDSTLPKAAVSDFLFLLVSVQAVQVSPAAFSKAERDRLINSIKTMLLDVLSTANLQMPAM